MKESQLAAQQPQGEDNVLHIPVSDVGYDGFKRFLRYLYGGSSGFDIYSNNNNTIDLQEILDVIQLADLHLLSPLKQQCERYILKNNQQLIKVENVCDLVMYADNLKMRYLRKFCIAFITKNSRSIRNSGRYKPLSKEVLEETGLAPMIKQKVNNY